jgi:hypothetical protein
LAHAFDRSQDEHIPEACRQHSNRGHGPFKFAAIVEPDVGRDPGIGDVDRLLEGPCKGKETADGAAASPVARFVDCDPRDPEPKRLFAVIAAQRGEGRDEALLGKV